MMVLNENDYILGYWFASDGEGNNWYMMIKKSSTEDNIWDVHYAFRYHFFQNDEKFSYNFKIDGNENEVIKELNPIINTIKLKYNDYFDFISIKGDVKKFFALAKNRPYMHITEERVH